MYCEWGGFLFVNKNVDNQSRDEEDPKLSKKFSMWKFIKVD